ncbi:MAG: hypothetical protein ACLTZI_10260 [[Eubacterium] siraeum]
MLVVILALIPVWIYRDTIFEPLRGIASRIQTTTTEAAGYPISLTGRSDYSFCAMNDSFALLSDTYLYSYNENGGQNFCLTARLCSPYDRFKLKTCGYLR